MEFDFRPLFWAAGVVAVATAVAGFLLGRWVS